MQWPFRSEIAAALALSLRSPTESPSSAAAAAAAAATVGDEGMPMDAVAEVEAWLALEQRMQDSSLFDGIVTAPSTPAAVAVEVTAEAPLDAVETERRRVNVAAAAEMNFDDALESAAAQAAAEKAAAAAEERERRRRDLAAAAERRAKDTVVAAAAAAEKAAAAARTAQVRRRVSAALVIQRRWRRQLLWERATAATAHAQRVAAAAGALRSCVAPRAASHRRWAAAAAAAEAARGAWATVVATVALPDEPMTQAWRQQTYAAAARDRCGWVCSCPSVASLSTLRRPPSLSSQLSVVPAISGCACIASCMHVWSA